MGIILYVFQSFLGLRKILGRKNPYLYQTYGINNPSEFIKKILLDFITSSDETVFGYQVFEKIAKALLTLSDYTP